MAKTMNDVLSKTKEVSELLGKRVEDIAKVKALLDAREKNIAQREKALSEREAAVSKTVALNNIDVQTEVVDSGAVSNRLFELGYNQHKLISSEPHPDAPGKQIIKYTRNGGKN